MFPEYADLMPRLKASNRQFASLLEKHKELDRTLQAMDSGMTSMVSISAMAYQPIALSQKFSDSPVTLSHQNISLEES